jgi:hypothetical protein
MKEHIMVFTKNKLFNFLFLGFIAYLISVSQASEEILGKEFPFDQKHRHTAKRRKTQHHDLIQKATDISHIPTEIKAEIFLFLDQKDFLRSSHVCHKWRASSQKIRDKKTLDLSGRELSEEDCEALLKAPFSTLILKGCGLKNQHAFILSKSTFFREMDLENNHISPEGVRAIATGNLTALISLNLGRNNIGIEGARAIATGQLSALTTLGLYNNDIGAEGAKAIATGNLAALKSLDLSCNNIGAEGARAIATGNLTALNTLNLDCNRIGIEGAKNIAAGNFLLLQVLDLTINKVGAEGAKAIAMENFPALTTLILAYNNVGVEGATAVLTGNLPALRTLDLTYTNVDIKNINTLKNHNPLCELIF